MVYNCIFYYKLKSETRKDWNNEQKTLLLYYDFLPDIYLRQCHPQYHKWRTIRKLFNLCTRRALYISINHLRLYQDLYGRNVENTFNRQHDYGAYLCDYYRSLHKRTFNIT